jgi:predicted DsbA family dithiol-disulfide isomerase
VRKYAAERGLSEDEALKAGSRLAHEAARFAARQGLFDAMNTALFRAFFEDGRDIGDLAELVKIGASIGMNAGELRQALDDGCHRKSVFVDEELAMKLTISGVPALAYSP